MIYHTYELTEAEKVYNYSMDEVRQVAKRALVLGGKAYIEHPSPALATIVARYLNDGKPAEYLGLNGLDMTVFRMTPEEN